MLLGTALPDGYDRESGPRICVQLFHDPADVVLDGTFRQKHGLGDLAVAPAVGDQIEDLFLLFAQRFRDALAIVRHAARIARVIGAVAASRARAPDAPQNFTASGNSVQGITPRFVGPEEGDVDHFVIAARSVNENFYRQRVVISEEDDQVISPQALGLNPGDSFFVSVSTVDSRGHESLFAYPEVRCDSTSCVIPSYANNVTASPSLSSLNANAEDDE